nr:hypothetical protein [Phycicoccus sp. CSK15P-2]
MTLYCLECAARVFAEGAARSRLQRTAATDAHRAAREATTDAARHAATAAAHAAAAAYLHPLAKATQLHHILGSPVHAARAAELARGDDPVVAEYVLTTAATRMTPVVRDVLSRYPRAPEGRSRTAALTARLDGLLRDPAPAPRVVDDPGPFVHGTRQALPREPDPVLPDHRATARRRGGHRMGAASAGDGPADP